jgi:hypothetical protein
MGKVESGVSIIYINDKKPNKEIEKGEVSKDVTLIKVEVKSVTKQNITFVASTCNLQDESDQPGPAR